MPAWRRRRSLFAGIAGASFSLGIAACTLDWDVRLDDSPNPDGAIDGQGKDTGQVDTGVIDAIAADQQGDVTIITKDASADCGALLASVNAKRADAKKCPILGSLCSVQPHDECKCPLWVEDDASAKAFEQAVAAFNESCTDTCKSSCPQLSPASGCVQTPSTAFECSQ